VTDFASAVKFDLLAYTNGEGLDIGCGDARPWDWFVGVDIKAGTTNRGPNQLRDARKLEGYFAAESQDFIFSSYLLNELDDWPSVLSSWWKLIKPNGYLILFMPVIEERAAEGDKPAVKPCAPQMVVDAMHGCRPWQFVEAKINAGAFFHVYRKCDTPTVLEAPDPEKICAVLKLGAHGDALWASSVLPHLKEQGYYVILYTQDTGEEVLRHDPHIDRLIKFESRVPMGELGELFAWMEKKYRNSRILVECVEGTLLPSPQKIQYWFPPDMRDMLMNFNYVEMHHRRALVPLEPRVKFYPNEEEKRWANKMRAEMTERVVVVVPNGSSVSKMWPYTAEFCERILKRKDVTVVMLGDERGMNFSALEDHKRFRKIGMGWNMRQAMTFVQLADVVMGQETGLLNAVSHESAVHKIVLLTHSSEQNLTRDWPNTVAIRTYPECAGKSGCHRLQYDWSTCNKDEATGASKCQAMIPRDEVMGYVEAALDVAKADTPEILVIEHGAQRLHSVA